MYTSQEDEEGEMHSLGRFAMTVEVQCHWVSFGGVSNHSSCSTAGASDGEKDFMRCRMT